MKIFYELSDRIRIKLLLRRTLVLLKYISTFKTDNYA